MLGSSPRMGLQLHVQDKRVVLNTSENLSLTWNQTCEENRTDSQLVPNERTNHSHQRGTCAPSKIARNSAVQQVEGTDALLSKRDGQLESDDVQILDDTASNDMQQAMSLSPSQVNSEPSEVVSNRFIEDSRMARTNPRSPQDASARNDQGATGRCTASVPNISEKRVASPSTAEPHGRPQPSSGEQRDCLKSTARNVGHNTGTAISYHTATTVKKMPLKSKMNTLRQPKRLSHSQRRLVQKNSPLTSRDRMRCPSLQWNVSSPPARASTVETCFSQPVISNVVGGQKAVEMTRLELDSASSWQSENAAQMEHQSDRYPHTGDRRQQAISIMNQNPAGPSSGRSYSQQTSAEDQPGCSMDSSKSYHQQHNNSLVPTSLTIAMGPSGDTPMSTAGDLSLVKQDMDSVFWTCLAEEPAEVHQGKVEEMQANGDVPVAADMAPLTAEDMTCSSVANKQIRLAHGYDVFIRQSDLFEAERACKQSWSILTRRLLDIYFDRMTLAMGRASLRGSNDDHKPLDQTIIGAIQAFIKARFNFDNRRKLMQVIGFYCSYSRNKLMHQLQYS
ncbi:uncharacterized protein LOC119738192 isoform X6 [Patiria miniata]|uniref:BEN domain-containing protein n=1 Tax=Patiria miniata TaxID=46514 RepID=A0A914AZH6_PATMI|nr:uncharacterized protein LOC119738192 isoform X6 [Patiria miniata]